MKNCNTCGYYSHQLKCKRRAPTARPDGGEGSVFPSGLGWCGEWRYWRLCRTSSRARTERHFAHHSRRRARERAKSTEVEI